MLRTFLLAAGLAGAAVSAPRPQQPVPVSTGLAHPSPYTTNVPAPGPGHAFRVSEAKQGNQDLNGDGDKLDDVLAIVPPGGGPAFVVGLASDTYGPTFAGHTVALGVFEGGQGGQDLNGDFDSTDIVVHLVDADTGAVTNTGLAIQGSQFLSGQRLAMSATFVAIAVDEAAQGATDLNGNGKTTDRVLHTVEIASGAVVNTGMYASRVAVEDDLIHGDASEFAFNSDINGDGDKSDFVQFLYDAVQGAGSNMGRASNFPIAVSGGYAAYTMFETSVGVDLNGDGDLADYVLQVHDVVAGSTFNLGLAVYLGEMDLDGAYAAIRVAESQQGSDLNGDGDLADFVVHSVHLPTRSVTNTALSGHFLGFDFSGLQEPLLVVMVNESFQGGQDLNGDGDAIDPSVLHYVRLRSGNVTNLGLQANFWPGGRLIGMNVSESENGGQDLNGDGDALDWVLHVHDARLGTTTNLGVEGEFQTVHGTGEDFLVGYVREGTSGVADLNGDGDTSDLVWHLFVPEQPPLNLGLAHGTPSWTSGRRVLFAVEESKQGAGSLNGDADTGDLVMHYVDVP